MTTQPNDIPIASPVLSYATHDADGTPDWVPEAEVRMEKGCRPRELRDLFRKSVHAVRYFGKSMTRRYGRDALGSRCVGCDAQEISLIIAVLWTATVRPRTLEYSSRDVEVAGFETLHPLCTLCGASWTNRLMMANIRRRRLRIARITVLVLWVVGGIIARSVIRALYGRDAIADWWLIAFWVGFIVLSIVIQFIDAWIVRSVPRYFRRLMPKDVQFNGLNGGYARNADGQLRSIW